MESQNKGIVGNIAAQPIAFAVAFLAFLFMTTVFMGSVDALPDPSQAATTTAHVSTAASASTEAQIKTAAGENPVRITIAKLGLDVTIKNPASTNVDVLDEALLTGAARYPTSAHLGENGTVLLFGHSSYLPIVHNQAYKAFKGIQDLKEGDIVSVYSATAEYRYAVTGVRVANADEDVIELPKNGKFLTLVTCDSFTKKTDRFVVTAKFVGAYPLASN